jgi:hypothetical protein
LPEAFGGARSGENSTRDNGASPLIKPGRPPILPDVKKKEGSGEGSQIEGAGERDSSWGILAKRRSNTQEKKKRGD